MVDMKKVMSVLTSMSEEDKIKLSSKLNVLMKQSMSGELSFEEAKNKVKELLSNSDIDFNEKDKDEEVREQYFEISKSLLNSFEIKKYKDIKELKEVYNIVKGIDIANISEEEEDQINLIVEVFSLVANTEVATNNLVSFITGEGKIKFSPRSALENGSLIDRKISKRNDSLDSIENIKIIENLKNKLILNTILSTKDNFNINDKNNKELKLEVIDGGIKMLEMIKASILEETMFADIKTSKDLKEEIN